MATVLIWVALKDGTSWTQRVPASDLPRAVPQPLRGSYRGGPGPQTKHMVNVGFAGRACCFRLDELDWFQVFGEKAEEAA